MDLRNVLNGPEVLTKKRNLLQTEKRGNLRLKLNQGLKLDKLIDKHQEQCSH